MKVRVGRRREAGKGRTDREKGLDRDTVIRVSKSILKY